MSDSRNHQLEIYYTSQNKFDHLQHEQHGLRAALETSAQQAYHAYTEIETARQTILGLDLEPPLQQFYEPARSLKQDSKAIHWLLTGRKSIGINEYSHGARLAAEHIPQHPMHATKIQDHADQVAIVGETLPRELGSARNCGDFVGAEDKFETLWDCAATFKGNATALNTALSDGFVVDAREHQMRKNGEWPPN